MSDADSRARAEAAFGAPAPAPSPKRPSRLGFVIGALVMALGVPAAIAWGIIGFVGFADDVDALQRVSIPGARTITLSEGRQSLYYEGHGEAVPVLRITVTAADGGTIPIEEHSGSVTYGVRGHNGESVAGIAIPRDGRYRVAVTPGPGGADARAILAIGPGVGSSIVEALVGAILLFIAAGAIGTVIIAVTFQRRRRARA